MSDEKRDRTMQRIQMAIGIGVGLVTLVVGVYNAKSLLFARKGPGAVAIQVRAESGQPLADAAVEISKVQGGVVASAETSPQGRYQKKGIEPGNYALQVARAGYQPQTLFFTVDPAQSSELTVAMKPSSASIRSALEEVGASWLKETAKPKPKSQEPEPQPARQSS